MDDSTPTAPEPTTLRARRPRRPREPGSPGAAGIAWAVTIGMVVLIAMLQSLGGKEALTSDPEAPVAATRAPAEPIDPGAIFETSCKYAVWSTQDPAIPKATREQAVTSIDALAADVYDRVRLAIVAGEAVGGQEARDRLDAIEHSLEVEAERDAAQDAEPDGRAPGEGDEAAPEAAGQPEADESPAIPEGLSEDIATLRTLYADGRTAVGGGERDRFVERYGWFGRLAFVHGLAADDPARAEVLAPAARVGRIIIAGLVFAGVLGMAGFVLFIVAIVRGATGSLRLRFRAPEPGGSAGIETFAIFLIAFMLLQAVMGALVNRFGDGLAPVAQLMIWLLVLVPLWPLLRGGTREGLRASLGWHRGEGVVREVGAGLVGYLAGLPVVGTGILLTVAVMAINTWVRGAPAEPPSHPLPDELGAGGPLIAIQLALMATVWAPLVEESHFRGALYSQLRGRLHPILAGLVTAFIFAAIHPQGVLAIPALMSLGFVFAMLREWRGSLIASMTAHALNNGMLVVMMLILFRG